MSQSAKKAEAVTAPPGNRKIKWIMAGFLLLLAAFIVMSLPRGYSDDLSGLGKGKPALVLIRDKNAVQSFDLMNVMDGVRDQYSGKVDFLLTDFDTGQGRTFIEKNHAARATLVLLDANGGLFKVLYAPQTTASLQQEISRLLGDQS